MSQRALALGSAAADGRLVHHVIVIESREVGQLDGDRGGHDPRVPRVAELGREQHQSGAEPLAPGLDSVPGGLRQQVVIGASRLAQAVLDLCQAVNDVGRQRGVWQLHDDWGAQSDSLGGGAPAPAANQPSADKHKSTPTICARQRNPRYARRAMREHQRQPSP